MSHRVIDCRGMRCPLPIIETAKQIREMADAEEFVLQSDDPATHNDLIAWARMTGHHVASLGNDEYLITAVKPQS
jgi:tRNA 2-thiouridine synthesizing protein A